MKFFVLCMQLFRRGGDRRRRRGDEHGNSSDVRARGFGVRGFGGDGWLNGWRAEVSALIAIARFTVGRPFAIPFETTELRLRLRITRAGVAGRWRLWNGRQWDRRYRSRGCGNTGNNGRDNGAAVACAGSTRGSSAARTAFFIFCIFTIRIEGAQRVITTNQSQHAGKLAEMLVIFTAPAARTRFSRCFGASTSTRCSGARSRSASRICQRRHTCRECGHECHEQNLISKNGASVHKRVSVDVNVS